MYFSGKEKRDSGNWWKTCGMRKRGGNAGSGPPLQDPEKRLRWSADRVTLHPGTWMECKRKVRRCSSGNRLSFSELFDDISLMLNVRRLCVVCGSSYQCRKSVWLCDFRMVLTGMWLRGWTAVSPKYSVPAINVVSSVFSLADCTLEK